MSDDSPLIDGWRTRFVEANNGNGVTAAWKEDDASPGGGYVSLSLPHRANTNDWYEINTQAVPPDEVVSIQLVNTAKWALANLGSRAGIRVSIVGNVSNNNGSLHLAESVEGKVEVDIGSSRLGGVSSEDNCNATLILQNGTLAIGEQGLGQHLNLVVAGGQLQRGNYGTVHLRSNCSVETVSNSPTSIERLVVDRDVKLEVVGNGNKLDIGTVESVEIGAPLLRVSRQPSNRNTNPGALTFSIKRLLDIAVAAGSSATIAIHASAKNVSFSGPMNVHFGGSAVGDGVSFPGDSGVPKITARPGAVVDAVTGKAVIADIKGAQVSGAPTGFSILDIKAPPTHSKEGPCDGALLSGFRIPSGLKGRSLLNYLDNAHYVEPATDNLPGWEYRLLGLFKRGQVDKNDSSQSLRHDTELMRKLRELTRSKGASGSTRTKVGWCAQRLRHLTTKGRIEKFALFGYRLLGYGERPGPAFITWLVASLIVTWIAASLCLGWLDSEGFIVATLKNALGPFAGMMKTDSLSSPDQPWWLFAARALLAVPLVVGILALRNYVRTAQ